MHNGYLGLCHNHCRKVWGMSITITNGDGYIDPSTKMPPCPDNEKIELALATLMDSNYDTLLVMDTSILWHLCADRDLQCSKKKKQMIKALREWVCV